MSRPAVEIRLLDPQALVVAVAVACDRLTATPKCRGGRDASKREYLFASGAAPGVVVTTKWGSQVSVPRGDVLLGSVTYRPGRREFVLHGWQAAGMWDEVRKVFEHLGRRCVYEG